MTDEYVRTAPPVIQGEEQGWLKREITLTRRKAGLRLFKEKNRHEL